MCCVDFAGSGLILNTAGEPPWLRGPIVRPLEPDAGNAAEGSEVAMRSRTHGFFVVRKTIRNPGAKEKKFLFLLS
jgi:hypothetical protein